MPARSRLKTPSPLPTAPSRLQTTGLSSKVLPREAIHQRPGAQIFWIKLYGEHLVLLLLAAVGYGITLYLITQTHPASSSHIPFPYFYAPLQGALLFGNFFFFSFVLLSARRGALISVLIALLLFLKLQSVVLDSLLVVGIMSFFLLIELLISLVLLKKKK